MEDLNNSYHKEKIYWNNRYSNGLNSGYGSYGEALDKKLKLISENVKDIKTISEIGCGDFNFGSNLLKLFQGVSYNGCDISEYIVDKNRQNYPQHFFTTDISLIPPADLVLCVDVLFHILDDDNVDKLFDEIEKRWTKYLVLTAYEKKEESGGHVKIRAFDPSRFGKPIIKEISENTEHNPLYLYIFKK